MLIRSATPEDAAELLAIYAQYIDTPITFEYELPSPEEFRDRIRQTLKDYPYIVAENEGQLIGYAYAGRFARRAAYQWGAELSIYLSRRSCGHGCGTRLYQHLIRLLQKQEIRTVYGIVTTPNPASEALHEKLGFHRSGLLRRAGYKNGAWHDVTWFEKSIREYSIPPAPPTAPVHA